MDCPSQKPDETADRQTERVKQQIAHEADTIFSRSLGDHQRLSDYPRQAACQERCLLRGSTGVQSEERWDAR